MYIYIYICFIGCRMYVYYYSVWKVQMTLSVVTAKKDHTIFTLLQKNGICFHDVSIVFYQKTVQKLLNRTGHLCQ